MGGDQAVAPLNDGGGMGRGKQAGIGDARLDTECLESQREVAGRAVVSFTEGGGNDKYAFFCRHLEFARGDFKTECGIASMDFSAFLGLPMQKKDDQPKLRTVDESPEREVSPLDGQAMGENEEKVRLEVKDRSELKFRTHEPKLEEWAGQDDSTLEDEWNTHKEPTRVHMGFWIMIGLIFLAGIAWLAFEISHLKQQQINAREERVREKEREEQSERDALQTIATIKDAVRQFYGAKSVDEMSGYVRHAKRVGPMMVDYYSKNPVMASEVVAFIDMNPITIGSNGGFWVILTKLSSGVDGKLVVEVNSPTDAKVDWETHVCAQPMDWERFVKERPAGYRADFRVYVEREDFYNYEFGDSEKYQAFKLTALNSYEAMHGYALRDGQAFRVIDELLTKNGNQKAPVILRLYLQEGLQSKSGVLIEEIVAPRWLIVNSPEVKK